MITIYVLFVYLPLVMLTMESIGRIASIYDYNYGYTPSYCLYSTH